MESSGTTPNVGISSSDLDDWPALRDLDGPVVSVYLDSRVIDADTPKRLELRWRAARAVLAGQGAPGRALEAVDARVDGAHTRGDGLVILASDRGELLSRDLTAPGIDDRFAVGPLPVLTPLFSWMQAREPYVVAVMDHLGADLVVSGRDGGEERESVGDTDSEDPLLHNPRPGGWSQARYQRRTKAKWRANAGDAATRLCELVGELRPRFVAVAGDTRAMGLLRDQLPPDVALLLREVSGTRAADGSDVQGDELDRLLRTVVAQDTVALTQQLEQELGQRDLGVVGAGPTLEALAQARVDTLLIHDDPADGRRAWVGLDTRMVSLRRADVEATGAQAAHEARLVDVAVWQTLVTGAAVRVTPRLAVLEDGIGAILRH